jgi:hypothetical protein
MRKLSMLLLYKNVRHNFFSFSSQIPFFAGERDLDQLAFIIAYPLTGEYANQSYSQTNHSAIQPTNKQASQTISQLISQLTNHAATNQLAVQPARKSENEKSSQPTSKPTYQPANHSASPTNQPANKSTNQSI